MSTRGSRSPTLISPVAEPPIGTPSIRPSARGSRNVSMTVLPGRRPGWTSRRACARSFAWSTRRSASKWTTPTGRSSSSAVRRRFAFASVRAASSRTSRAERLVDANCSGVQRHRCGVESPAGTPPGRIDSPITVITSTPSMPRGSHTPGGACSRYRDRAGRRRAASISSSRCRRSTRPPRRGGPAVPPGRSTAARPPAWSP